jgi:hypothetical protein
MRSFAEANDTPPCRTQEPCVEDGAPCVSGGYWGPSAASPARKPQATSLRMTARTSSGKNPQLRGSATAGTYNSTG